MKLNSIKKGVWLLAASMLVMPHLLFAVGGSFQIERMVTFLALGTGATTGTYFPLGNAFANVWTTGAGNISVMSHSTRGSVDNIQLLRRHELNLGIAQSDTVMSALNGTGSFSGDPYKELRVLMALYPEVVQVLVNADSDINEIGQLRNHRVIVGAPGSGNSLTSFEILAACGVAKDEFTPVYISYDEAIQSMERRDCDAAIIIAGIPTRAISELQLRIKTRMLTFPKQEIERLTAALPYLSPLSIAPGVYSAQPETVDTIALTAVLVADANLPENLAYQLIQGIFDNIGYLQKMHERACDISIETFLNGVPETAIHPGAQRFYSEYRRAE